MLDSFSVLCIDKQVIMWVNMHTHISKKERAHPSKHAQIQHMQKYNETGLQSFEREQTEMEGGKQGKRQTAWPWLKESAYASRTANREEE